MAAGMQLTIREVGEWFEVVLRGQVVGRYVSRDAALEEIAALHVTSCVNLTNWGVRQ
jgi:hypothetical protein